MTIAKAVVIKGELVVVEDLLIEGHVEGVIQIPNHVLTIGPTGQVSADVYAKSVVVMGAVTGTITATEKIDIRDNGSVDGEMLSPRIRIAEGALFHGFVEMPKPRRAAAVAHDATGASVWLVPEKNTPEKISAEKSATEKKPEKKTAGQAAAVR